MIAICGLICNDCPAYIATQKDDDEMRKKIAEEWSSDQYPLKPEDINCCIENLMEINEKGLEQWIDK